MAEHIGQRRVSRGLDPYAEGKYIPRPTKEQLALANFTASQRMNVVSRRATLGSIKGGSRDVGPVTEFGMAQAPPERRVEANPLPTYTGLVTKARGLGIKVSKSMTLRDLAHAIEEFESKSIKNKKG